MKWIGLKKPFSEIRALNIEDLWIRLGYSTHARILVVVFCEKIEGEKIRIISASKAIPQEKGQYHQR